MSMYLSCLVFNGVSYYFPRSWVLRVFEILRLYRLFGECQHQTSSSQDFPHHAEDIYLIQYSFLPIYSLFLLLATIIIVAANTCRPPFPSTSPLFRLAPYPLRSRQKPLCYKSTDKLHQV
jgi:hypothetical protein